MRWFEGIKRRSEDGTWGERAVFWSSLAALWLVIGGMFALFAAPKTWKGAALIIVVGPPLYVFGELLIPYLWTDDKDDGESEGLATIKRLWRFTVAVVATGAFFALLYFVFNR